MKTTGSMLFNSQKKYNAFLVILIFLLLTGHQARAQTEGPTKQLPVIVIILDDIGNQLQTGIRVLQLPGKLNIGILPHTPNSEILAEMAPAAGKEVILHAPMSNSRNKRLGPGALTSHMPEQAFRDSLNSSIASTPHVRGLSNHMGSELTSKRQPMEWVMESLAQQGLYFVDSRTSPNTVAAEVAKEYKVPHLSRRVFLDNVQETSAVEQQFNKLMDYARAEGVAVAIGHPYPVTLSYLEEKLPVLRAEGFRLALVSEVLAQQSAANTLED